MSLVPPVTTTTGSGEIASPQGTGAFSAKPEHTLLQLEQLFAEQDEALFQQNIIAFAASITGARMGLLYAKDGKEFRPRIVTTPEGGTSAFTAQQQVDLIAATAVNQGASQRATVSLADGRFALICVPFALVQGEPLAIALLLGPDRAQFIEPAFTVLHLMTQVFVRRQLGVDSVNLRNGFAQSTTLIDLFSRTARATEFREAVSIVCDEFRELIGCSKVAISLGTARRCKVYGMSGAGRIGQRTQGTTLLENCMTEAIGVDTPVIWPERRDLTGPIISAPQNQLLETLGATEALTFPLIYEEAGQEEVLGAWTFLWDKDTLLTQTHYNLIEAASSHVAALIYLSGQSHPRGIKGAMRRFAKRASKLKESDGCGSPDSFSSHSCSCLSLIAWEQIVSFNPSRPDRWQHHLTGFS